MDGTNSEIAKAALTPGEETTEFAAKQNTSWWAKVVAVAGMATVIIPQVIAAVQGTAIESTKWGATTISILGGVMVLAGIIANGSVNAAYVTGRSLVKASAVRDLDLTQIPKA